MTQSTLPLEISPPARRRGRPPGSGNKRSLDLARYVEATFGGMTPGQQAAALSMVTPKEIRNAKADAKSLVHYAPRLDLAGVDLPPVQLAMAVKATRLALALGCDAKEAWLLMQKEREGLMPYVHQKRPQAPEEKPSAALPLVVMMGDSVDQGRALDATGEDLDRIEFLGEIQTPSDQVGK